MDDDQLMSAEQRLTLLTVVEATNRGADVYGAAAERVSPAPERHEMAALIRILRLPAVGFRRGQDPDVVLARILDLLEAAAAGEDVTPIADGTDERY